jgi:hypothetical protein
MLDNWSIYTISDHLAVDRVIRFENLKLEFEEVLSNLQVRPLEVQLFQMKGGFRPSTPYQSYYTEETKEIVLSWYRKEIEFFGYDF